MKKWLIFLCVCVILAGCSAKVSTGDADSSESAGVSGASGKEEMNAETETGRETVESTEAERAEDVISFLEKFEPELTFTPMEANKTVLYEKFFEGRYEVAGRKTEDGFGYIIAVLKDGKTPLEGWNFVGEDDFIAAERWNGKLGEYEHIGKLQDITAVYQGDGSRILYMQPGDYVMPDELQEVFYYQYCSGAEGSRYLQDVIARGVRFSPPDNSAYLSVERFEQGVRHIEYVPLTSKEERAIIESKDVIDPAVYGNYGIQFYVSEATYENGEVQEGRITAPALAIAEERCRFKTEDPSEIHDIVKAELKMKFLEYDDSGSVSREWEESETLSGAGDLKLLEEILISSEPTFEGKCPYRAILTLTRKDGQEIVLQLASDSCDGFIMGSHAFYSPGEEKTGKLWDLFPAMKENVGRADSQS